jgi:hypothetical protein
VASFAFAGAGTNSNYGKRLVLDDSGIFTWSGVVGTSSQRDDGCTSNK